MSDDDRPVLRRALEIALPHVEADAAAADEEGFVERLLAVGPDLRILAHAVFAAGDRLRDIYESRPMPTSFRCGWCHAANGGTKEAWAALPEMSDAAIKAHAVTCEHNPLVERLRRALALAREGFSQGWDTLDQRDRLALLAVLEAAP